MTVLIALLGFIFLIVIHELGHMLTAKALGVRVDEFGVGFGPALFKKKIGKTIYSFRIILLGGFAKMAGMEDIGSVAQQKGELGPDTYPAKPPWKRALIIFAGPAVNIVACMLILAGIFMFVGSPSLGGVTTEVDEVTPNSLASEVGVRSGDRLVAIGGNSVQDWEDLTQFMQDREPGDQVTLAVERSGGERTFSGELSADPRDENRAIVGIRPEARTYGPIQALGMGVQETVNLTGRYFQGIYQLITGELDFFKNINGPVGIVGVSSESVSLGLFPMFLAFLSLILGIMNLLPILPLDGGHLLFIAAEKIIGRPVSAQTMGKVAFLGIALMFTLFLFATYADVSKIIEGQPFIPE